GFSGISLDALDALIALVNAGVHPAVPSRGSVGASGDLAPLAHLALVLIGEGGALDNGRVIPGADALRRAGLAPIRLGPKEGLAADLLAAAIVPLATISERRTDRLVDPSLSGLPAFLTRAGGLQSGFMLAQVTAAAVASELKSLAHPAGVDTIPTSANKEDHVSMSMTAALKAERAVACAREVTAIELLCACQAIDLLAPLTT